MADATLRIDADTRSAERALGSLQTALKGLATGVVIKGFQQFADQATELRNRLNLVSSSVEQNDILFNKLVKTATDARTPLSQTGDLFFRIARNTDALGISQSQAIDATEAVAKAISSSGISAREAAGPLLQLGQALQSGTLQGDELRSILEGLPPVAKAIADSMGVPIAQLRKLGSQGKISSQQVIQAILAAKDTIDKDFAKTVPTIGQSFTILETSVIRFVDRLNRATGASDGASTGLQRLSSAIDGLSENIGIVVSALSILTKIVLAIVAWTVVGRVITFISAAMANLAAISAAVQGVAFNLMARFNSLGKVGALLADAFAWIGVKLSDLIRFEKPVQAFLGIFAPLFQGIAAAVVIFWDNIKGAFTSLIDFAKSAIGYIGNLLGLMGKKTETPIVIGQQADIRRIDNAIEAINRMGKGIKLVTADQEKFNKEFAKTLTNLQTETALKQASLTYSNDEVEMMRLMMELLNQAKAANAEVTAEQMKQYVAAIQQNQAIANQIKQVEALNQLYQEATGNLETIKTSLDERYKVYQDYTEQLLNLEEAYQAGVIKTVDEYARLREQLELQYAYSAYDAKIALEDRYWSQVTKSMEMYYKQIGFNTEKSKELAAGRVAFEKKSEQEKAQWAIQQGASVFDELGKYNKQAFQAAKAFNIANAIMNTYTGATKALAMYPPPFNFIAAAAVVASGLAQVATIRSQQYSGRALGGPVMNNQPYIVGEKGPELFVPNTTGSITPNNQLVGGAPVNITFQIQANDTRGFDQLLADRKPMIINMVRTAMNDRGNRANV